MSKYRTTRLLDRYSPNTIPLLWFVQADEEHRKTTESALNDIAHRLDDHPGPKPRKISGVPWLRNHTPSMTDVSDTVRAFEMGDGHALGIDAQSVDDGSLFVLHCISEREPEVGRASREDAIRVLLKERLYAYTLEKAFNGHPFTRINIPSRSPEPEIEDRENRYSLPSHIPSDKKLREEEITLFSLIKLTDEEISQIKQDIGDTTNAITIYNWPHDTPSSQAEIYNLFQCVKPGLVDRCGQTFVMFIDAVHTSTPQRTPVVVVASESTPELSTVSEKEMLEYKHIYLQAVQTQKIKELWPLIWHPQYDGTWGTVAVNKPLFSHPYIWDLAHYRNTFIAEPGLAICANAANQRPEFVVYIICSVTCEELRRLREIVVDENGCAVQLLELNLVPREVGAEREPEASTRLDPLLRFFDTKEYRAVTDPPSMFVFLDNLALDHLLTAVTDDPVIPLAELHHYYTRDDNDGMIAEETPAYVYAEFSIRDDLSSALANLETGNMSFYELSMSENGMEVVFWPEYRGSMTREMLDIDYN
jgi:hypothetical protein